MLESVKETWTVVLDYKGGTYVRQYSVLSIDDVLPSMMLTKGEPFCHFSDFGEKSEWVPVSGTTSVLSNSGLSEDGELYIIHAILTDTKDSA